MERALQATEANPITSYWTQVGITSHHLPTASSFIAEFYRALKDSGGPRDTLVILGPDHFERCLADISTSKKPWLTPFGELLTNEEIIDKLLSAGVYQDSRCLDTEHSIGIQTIFIKYLFPDSRVVPIAFSAETQESQLEKIVNVLVEYKNRVTVVCSVDFSHAQGKEQADELDQASEQMLKAQDTSGFFLEYVDSPSAVKLTIELAKRFYQAKTVILGRANSSDFNYNQEATTGYINTLFVR